MNKIECIEKYLASSSGPSHSRRRKSNLAELPLPIRNIGDFGVRLLPAVRVDRRLQAGGRSESPHERGPGSMRLIAGGRGRLGTSVRRSVNRHMVEGAYLFAAVSVAAVLWWTTL